MIFSRERYLKKLIDKKNNGMVKIITGIRRCGKSYLLPELFQSEKGGPIQHYFDFDSDTRSRE